MGVNDIILYVMVVFMFIGAVDRASSVMFNKSIGFAKHFEDGFLAMGTLAMATFGVVCASPVLAAILTPILTPVYQALGASPAMFATTVLACDMGGYTLAMDLAGADVNAGKFAGVILGSMMGPTVIFSIPVALGIIPKSDRQFLAKGIMLGMITIPLGCFVGGLVAGYSIGFILSNLVPVVIFAAFIAVMLFFFPKMSIRFFDIFGKVVIASITVILAFVIVETLTGLRFIKWTTFDAAGVATTVHMAPILNAMQLTVSIVIVLAGAFPLVYFLTTLAKKPLLSAGKKLGINDFAAAGIVASLANNILMFAMLKDMDDRGKVINVAFTVSAAFAFGDHLGFAAGVEKDMIVAMIAGKLTGGISAVLLALMALSKDTRNSEKKVNYEQA